MYSLINTVCTGADLKAEQNWLERRGRQGRKTMFIRNRLHFLVTKLIIEASVTSLDVPKEGNSHPENRPMKRECQISPSSFFLGETDFIGFGVYDVTPGGISPLLMCWSFLMTKALHISCPTNQLICLCLLNLSGHFNSAISEFMYLDEFWYLKWNVLVLKLLCPCMGTHVHGFPVITASPCSLICLLDKMKGASTEYERNSASQHWLLPHIY